LQNNGPGHNETLAFCILATCEIYKIINKNLSEDNSSNQFFYLWYLSQIVGTQFWSEVTRVFGSLLSDVGQGLLPFGMIHSEDPYDRVAHTNFRTCDGIFQNEPITFQVRMGKNFVLFLFFLALANADRRGQKSNYSQETLELLTTASPSRNPTRSLNRQEDSELAAVRQGKILELKKCNKAFQIFFHYLTVSLLGYKFFLFLTIGD
jgi:hypothetical protein